MIARTIRVDGIQCAEASPFGHEPDGRPRPNGLRGLRLFAGDYPEAYGYLLYGGTRRYQFDQIEVIPFAEAIPKLGTLLARS